MGLAGGNRPHPRAVIFDLDRCLIDSRRAWLYCIEEAFATTGRTVRAEPLADEYHVRPWRDAIAVLAEDISQANRCESLCESMYERSAMKKLLVHEGVGMALDTLRAERIELGAISRLPHGLAVKQVQSTGLDRFLAVVAASPGSWAPVERVAQCLTFLEAAAENCAFVSGDEGDLGEVAASGPRPFFAAWAAGAETSPHLRDIGSPAALREVLLRDWAAHY